MRRSWGQDVRVSAVVISFLAEHPDNATRGRQMRPADLPWRGIPSLYTCLCCALYLVAAVSEKELGGRWPGADRLAGLAFTIIYLCRRKVKEV